MARRMFNSAKAISDALSRLSPGDWRVTLASGKRTAEVCEVEPWSSAHERRTCWTVPTRKIVSFLSSCRQELGGAPCDRHDLSDVLEG